MVAHRAQQEFCWECGPYPSADHVHATGNHPAIPTSGFERPSTGDSMASSWLSPQPFQPHAQLSEPSTLQVCGGDGTILRREAGRPLRVRSPVSRTHSPPRPFCDKVNTVMAGTRSTALRAPASCGLGVLNACIPSLAVY